jgi:hypothetical protein
MRKLHRPWKAVRDFIEGKAWYVTALILVVLVVFSTVIGYYISNIYAFWDRDPNRGATTVANDSFGDVANRIVYLDQGWQVQDSLWFDNITQGSDLLPYDFFLVLEQHDRQLFRSNENMNNRFRYLARKPTFGNPDGLPIGMVKDTYLGRDFMGFTCAACHTAQINYKGTGIRIDGAPAMADMDSFLNALGTALYAASDAQGNPDLHSRFVKNVVALGHYNSEAQVDADLKKYTLRLATYRIINRSDTRYGFARLDAFGRIYNQVLEYVVTVPDIKNALNELIVDKKISVEDLDRVGLNTLLGRLGQKDHVLSANDRDAILESLSLLAQSPTGKLSPKGLIEVLNVRKKIFNPPNAPVSYPFLWDIPQHDYIQWNGIAPNSGLGPIGRNTGEVIGVFGTMNWSQSDHWTLAGVLSGQGLFNTSPVDFSSSVNVHNLALIEDHLKTLQSPAWPGEILGTINYKDEAKPLWQRGKILFERYCSQCHANIDRTASDRRIVAHMSAQDHVKTDPAMAVNSVGYQGYSGILRNQYVTVGPGALLLDKRAAVAALLTKATTGVVATPDSSKWFGQRFVEWAYDLIFSLRNNNIQPSLKNGDYHPDTTAAPLASIVAYKGRALDGIWATAPYLHNGSVPTLYDLLLPAGPLPGGPPIPGDLPGMEYRPSTFMVGSREFDPVKVGFKTSGYAGFEFLTTKPGNSNAGHEYGARPTPVLDANGQPVKNKDGTDMVIPTLTKEQRMDLIEYLKSL